MASTSPPPILRPVPRRPFQLNLDPKTSNATTSTGSETKSLQSPSFSSSGKTRSFLNLTSSTLFGIYSPTAFPGEPTDTPTSLSRSPSMIIEPSNSSASDSIDLKPKPAELTRQRRQSTSQPIQTSLFDFSVPLVLRIPLLFLLGAGYGMLVTRLHDERPLAEIKIDGIIKPRYNWAYLCFWGIAGVVLGSLLPYIDTLFPAHKPPHVDIRQDHRVYSGASSEHGGEMTSASGMTADWNSVVRSIGAFVGIAFAIRKLPWTSALQMSATLALVNPFLWYLVDRSKPGFYVSSSVGLLGTVLVLLLNPEIMPAPQTRLTTQLFPSSNMTSTNGLEGLSGIISRETLECGTWIISVLFCSSVCFGNIGRRLAVSKSPMPRRDSIR